MHQKNPKVSIGMPVYNGEAYLAEAISSVLSQTFQDFELLICDNASTDGTEEICRMFAASDLRVRYIRQPDNRGATWNFNYALQLSRGEFFKWHAHDDLMHPDFLARCVGVLDHKQNLVLVFPRTILIDGCGTQTMCYLDLMASESENAASRFRQYVIPGVGEPNPIFGLMRRAIVMKHCTLESFVSADLVFLGQIALLGPSRLVNEPLFLRRIHPGISVKTHPDSLSREEFHTGRKARGLRFRTFRLLAEFAQAINRTPISRSERIECYRVLGEWSWQQRFRLAKELAIPLYVNGRPTAFGRWVYHLIKPNSRLRSEK